MITCPYCGSKNKDNTNFCTVCYAPRKHNFAGAKLAKADLLSIAGEQSLVWAVQGDDQSTWNGTMNAVITRTRAQFSHLRGGYGNNMLDPKYPIYRDLCDQWQIERGLYWYCWIGQDYKAHAASIASLWKQSPGKLEITTDAEDTTVDPHVTAQWLYYLVQELQMKTGEVPMIYTGPYWWNTHVERNTWARELPLWIGCWNETATAPLVPYDWSENVGVARWRYWQWSADGNGLASEYGFTDGDADIDLNRFNGSVDDFNKLHGTSVLPLGVVAPIEVPEPMQFLYRAKVTASALNVRQGPSVSTADLGELLCNSVVPVVEEKDGWIRIDGWINKSYTKAV